MVIGNKKADAASLAALVAGMRKEGNVSWSDDRLWQVNDRTPSHDFNREIVQPGQKDDYPDGAVLVMSDWNFWCVATLPPEYAVMDCAALVAALWPGIDDPVILPDDGDYWWTAKCDETLEVPGEPYECWHHIRYEDGHETVERFNSYVSVEELEEAARKARWSMTEGCVCRYQVRIWKDGKRVEQEPKPVPNITYTPPRPPREWPMPPAS